MDEDKLVGVASCLVLIVGFLISLSLLGLAAWAVIELVQWLTSK